jgi:thioredoxin reductase (NADPH)
MEKLIILGSGPAAFAAALCAGKAALAPMVAAGPQRGGQITPTGQIDDYPGFPRAFLVLRSRPR